MTLGDKLNELNQAEESARKLLEKLGWTYVHRDELAPERADEREVLLKGRLKSALLRLNEWMTNDQGERVIFNLEHIDATGIARNQHVHEYLTYGMPVDVDGSGGRRTRTVQFFDFTYPEPAHGRNEYVVTTQYRVRRGNERDRGQEDDERVVKPDLVLFVNGIPLVVMEAKSPTLLDVWKTRAVKQLQRYQEADPKWHGTGAPELFDYNLLCIAHCGASAVYAPAGAPEQAYVEWKSVLPYTEDEVRQRFGEEPQGLAQLIIGLLSPATLLDILRDYVVYESEQGRVIKKLPRYQQYRAVTSAMQRILEHEKPEERGGVVWHTQGSGKSLTMLWVATKLRREPRLQNPTIMVVTDRTQLDWQITKVFENTGDALPERASTARDLRQRLSGTSGRTVMTTIQKFEDALSAHEGEREVLNEANNVFVMVDEAHRTQYGVLGARMSQALPNATFIGFTGTPIDKGFKRSTMRRFGPLIDAYTIPQSVADGATVPIYYQARLPKLAIQGPNTLDRLYDALFSDESDEVREQIRRKYANKETVAKAAKRIEMIALDIAEHFKAHVRPNGFKAQVVAGDRELAIKYAEHLRDFGLSAYPIITTSANDGAEFKWARELPQAKITSDFVNPNGEPEVLVVVDMLLTGFDAPVEQVLYLDRSLREHGLLQAIARVNRPFSHDREGVRTEKTYGLVVDYYGVSQELDQALAAFEKEDTADAMHEQEQDPATVIEDVARKAEAHFTGLDLDDTWACVMRFAPDQHTEGALKEDLFERFNADYREFSQLMDRFMPDPRALPYTSRLARLTKIRAYVRAHFLREDSPVDWAEVGAKVQRLLDERIDADVRELMQPISILDQDFQQKIAQLPHEEARASVMEHAIRAQIKDRLSTNPAFYEKLSEQLERIIRELRQRLIDSAEACQRMFALRAEMQAEAQVASEHGLSPVSFAVYELLERAPGTGSDKGSQQFREEPGAYRAQFDEGLKEAATRLESVIVGYQDIVDWQDNYEAQREMRRDLKRELRKTPNLTGEQIETLAQQMLDIARSGRTP